jgi:hypothetical protein
MGYDGRMRLICLCVLASACNGAPTGEAAPTATATATASASATVPAGRGCDRSFDAHDDSGFMALPMKTIPELLRDKPREGSFRTQGYPVAWHPCPKCLEEPCAPCSVYVVLSDADGADRKQPSTPDRELRVQVPRPSELHRVKRYDVGIEVCTTPSPEGDPLHVEIRGFAPVVRDGG